MFDATREGDNDTELQMAPLIDCVFLLLIFFLVATTLKEQKLELPLDLPDAVSAQIVPQDESPFIVSIDKAGGLYLGAEPVTTDALHRSVRQVAQENPARRIRIDFDKQTPAQALVQVLDLVNFEGLENVGIHIADPRQRK